MPRTSLLTRLQRIAARASERQDPDPSAPTRREFLVKSATAAGGAILASSAFGAPMLRRKAPPTVAIVGGGLAGLVAARNLRKAKVPFTLYEASARAGGRVFTKYGFFAGGQHVERGGELIDTGHVRYRNLIENLGFKLDNLVKAEADGTEPLYYFDGVPYTFAEAEADFAEVYPALNADVKAASYPTLYNSFNAAGAALDNLSIAAWIESRVPGGLASKFGRLLEIAYVIEYGAEAADQSSLNLVYLLGYGSKPNNFAMFGVSDEVFHVRGGNDQVPSRLSSLLGDSVKLSHKLIAASTLPSQGTRLTFDTPGGVLEVDADFVIMTLPFSILRASVDISGLAVKPLKSTAIQELSMGRNSKLHVQFTDRHWTSLDNNGDTVADTGYQNTWEVTRAQAGQEGILVDYTGGDTASALTIGTPASQAATFLARIEPVLPGLTVKWNGLATLDAWETSPFQLGSYSYWRPGQYTQFAGVEAEREGTVLFAGEHTSVDYQGFMEGAVRSGERAAKELLPLL